jgi:hypothetical protein
LAAAALAFAGDREAAACGGCFHPPPPPNQTSSDITDERMLLSVSTVQSTLYDQILYSGNPTSFAWVLPIVGTVDIGLSADVLFDSMDALTATQIVAPPYPCAPPPFCGNALGATVAGSGSTASTGSATSAPPPVTVTKQENVGPYATVQLQSTDAGALESWLAQNGFVIPTDVQPVVAAYVAEGFNFLAMKLLPNQGVQAMRPVRVTTQGASLSLPLRMASIGTGAVVGITIWVVADGRYEPQNYPFFHIDDSQLVWDWSTNLSNYTTLRAQDEANLGGKGWEIESSLTLNQQSITDTIFSGGQYLPNGGFGPITPTSATDDYLAAGDPDAGDDAGYQSADDVRAADVAALFVGVTGPNARVTRFRGDIAHAAMTKDLVLQASADQSEVSNVRNVTESVNANCAVYPPCSTGGFGSGTVSGSGSPFGSVTPGGASSSGGTQGAPVSNQGQLDGCTASARPRGGLAAELGAMAAIGGLVVARLARARRRRSKLN